MRRRPGFAVSLLGLALVPLACHRPAPPPGRHDASTWQRIVAVHEYEASPADAGLQAPNRAHGLRTWFASDGVRVHDRRDDSRGALVSLRLARVGRGEALVGVPPGELVADGARVEIRRPGLVEWYVNSPAGLEQGFTLAERPQGKGPLLLELALGDAQARADGEGVLLVAAASGRRLRYGGIEVVDAAGTRRPARIEVAGSERLRLVVDDDGASYPLVVDPLLTDDPQVSQLESGQKETRFGFSVAGAGDVDGDGYDDVIVGAPEFDGGRTNEGAVFLFTGGPDGIASGGLATAMAKVESDKTGAQLGWSVSGAGDVNGDGFADVIAGAPYFDEGGQLDEGFAFVLHGGPAGIAGGNVAAAAARLQGEQAYAWLGSAVAGAGDVNGDGYDDVVVGAPRYDVGEIDEGAAFVFLGGASGVGDGAPAAAATRVEADQAGAQLGEAVAGAGDVNGDGYGDVIVGSPAYDVGVGAAGAAFVFLGSAAGVADGSPSTAATRLSSDQFGARFAESVAGAGDVNRDGFADVIVGAPLYNAPTTDEGAAFVFLGSASGVAYASPASANAVLESDQVGAQLGEAVAGAGDVDGDGFDDVVVGAPSWYDANYRAGLALVFRGGSAGVVGGGPAAASVRIGIQDGYPVHVEFGTAVGSAGDVNGDGFADFVVGAPGYGGALRRVCSYDCYYRAETPSAGAALVVRGEGTESACRNGRDDDGDGASDWPADPGCFDALGDREDPECSDGLDNDGDGHFDWDGAGYGAVDLQCTNRPWLDREVGVCGLGFELALVLPVLLGLRRGLGRGFGRA